MTRPNNLRIGRVPGLGYVTPSRRLLVASTGLAPARTASCEDAFHKHCATCFAASTYSQHLGG